jgi:hypothetical protein
MGIISYCLRRQRDYVHGHKVHQIHQEYPAENRESQRSEIRTLAVKTVLDAGLDHFDNKFNGVLQSARHTRGGFTTY